jgi:hypothetical protein
MADPILEARLSALERHLALVGRPDAIAVPFQWEKTPFEEQIWDIIWKRLAGEITRQVICQKKKINEIRADLEVAGRQADASQRKAGVARAWERYIELNEQCQAISNECLDLISGLAFREKYSVLDTNNVCQVADELIWTCSTSVFVSPSLTVPSPREPFVATLGRILRLRYSEWAVWPLPLIAHEFGHVVVSDPSHAELLQLNPDPVPRLLEFDPEYQTGRAGAVSEAERERAESRARRRASDELQEYLADAFGTYVMGPAYPSAAIHLRLNPVVSPSEPDAENRIDRERAHVMLGILRKMNEETVLGNEYGVVLEKLNKIWERMVGEANPEGQPDARLWEDKQRVLDETVDTIWAKFGAHLMDTPRYPHNERFEGWSVAKQWGGKWVAALKGSYALPLPEVTAQSMLRDALNAGWLCRIEVEQPQWVSDIESRVSTLCREIIRMRLRGGGASGSFK